MSASAPSRSTRPILVLAAVALLAPAASGASPPFVIDLERPTGASPGLGATHDLVVTGIGGSSTRSVGATFDLAAPGATSPRASAAAVQDGPTRADRLALNVTFPDVTFDVPGEWRVTGPDGFHLSFAVGAPGGAPSDPTTLILDGSTHRILQPGRPAAGATMGILVLNVSTSAERAAGAEFALFAPGAGDPLHRGAATDGPPGVPGTLQVAFPAVTFAPGRYSIRGPGGFDAPLRIDILGATVDPTEAGNSIRPVNDTNAPPIPVGGRADVSFVLIPIEGDREVNSTFQLVAPSGAVVDARPAWLIEQDGAESLGVTFPDVRISEGGTWRVRGPEGYSFAFQAEGRAGVPAPAAWAALGILAAAAIALGRRG